MSDEDRMGDEGHGDGRRWAGEVRAARDSLDTVAASTLRLVYEQAATTAEVAAQLGVDEVEVERAYAVGLRDMASILCAPTNSATRPS